MSKINVYEHRENGDGRGSIVAQVEYNSKLDHWDGHNWTSGGTGMHLGITRLKKSGKMVLIYGTQWQGAIDYGVIVSDAEALQAILDNDPDELDSWPHLQELRDKTLDTEAE